MPTLLLPPSSSCTGGPTPRCFAPESSPHVERTHSTRKHRAQGTSGNVVTQRTLALKVHPPSYS